MTVERREEKVGKPLLTGSALGGDKFRDICDMETIPPEKDVLINNAKIPISKVLNHQWSEPSLFFSLLLPGWKTVAQKEVLNSAYEVWNAVRTQRKTRKG